MSRIKQYKYAAASPARPPSTEEAEVVCPNGCDNGSEVASLEGISGSEVLYNEEVTECAPCRINTKSAGRGAKVVDARLRTRERERTNKCRMGSCGHPPR